ncbi:50 kDa [Spodoptera frugiperda ascovirus 1a]|uniref:50 kDa n=1 Tax=Spodoptera frugiperda ascovirus 1a TaxID=113370 RepID=Q0E581_SFAVA|nr:50 kDa [Spodoptera frugiperda ascovirus 1a]CAL44620.1 50 kDa [Spodoptera frugiperda ascovirus 1a]
MQNLAEDTVRALAKYGTFAVDSSRILYRLLCNIRSPIDYNEQDLDRIAQVLTSLRRTSLSCMVGARSMDVIVAQNAVIADIFDLNDHECDDDNALNDDCSIDVTAMLMVMAMGRPTVVDGRPNLDVDETPDTDAEEWCSRYSLKCPTLVAKNLRRYLAADAKYDFMSEYLNVKLRGVATRDDDVNWCKIPISFVHNYIMTRTCFGLVVYDYVLKSCADYKTEPLEFNYNDHMLFVKACSGEVSDYTLSNTTLMSYFDRMLLKYTIPVDVFCSDEMSNYVIHLKKLDASVKVISWSVTSTRIHTERCLMSIHPTLFMIANAVRSADESSPSALLAKFKQLRFNMMMAKCNISSSISDVDKIVENNVQVLRKYCDGDCLPQLIDHVRNKRNSHVTEHRLRKPVQALTNNSTLKRKTIVNDEHSVVLSNKCQLPKKRRLLVL